jgi:hypothetical protein
MLLLAVAGLATTGCEQIEAEQKQQANTEPEIGQELTANGKAPLLLDNEPLLLLNDSMDADRSASPTADNSRCFVCHINYMQEAIAVSHARANIGCKGCHGESDAHIADESWASGGNGTPPDVMYPRAKINAACMACHSRDKIDTEQHQVLFASTAETKACTDCHGSHRLARRTCKWK